MSDEFLKVRPRTSVVGTLVAQGPIAPPAELAEPAAEAPLGTLFPTDPPRTAASTGKKGVGLRAYEALCAKMVELKAERAAAEESAQRAAASVSRFVMGGIMNRSVGRREARADLLHELHQDERYGAERHHRGTLEKAAIERSDQIQRDNDRALQRQRDDDAYYYNSRR